MMNVKKEMCEVENASKVFERDVPSGIRKPPPNEEVDR